MIFLGSFPHSLNENLLIPRGTPSLNILFGPADNLERDLLPRDQMLNKSNLNDAALNKFVREINSGDYLFKQAQRGNTMYVIVDGLVKVFFKAMSVDRLVGLATTGEVIGEKAILSEKPYKRDFSAQAKTNCTLL